MTIGVRYGRLNPFGRALFVSALFVSALFVSALPFTAEARCSR